MLRELRARLSDAHFLKYFSLISLTLQNVTIVLLTRHSRARPGDLYFTSTAVVMSEAVKLTACIVAVFFEEGFSLIGFWRNIRINILDDPWDCLLISIPGLLYTVQNNLLFVAYSHLSAVSFQMSYQLKIFTTAIFFRILLGRNLNRMQWLSLFVLFTGVVLNQTGDLTSGTTATSSSDSSWGNKAMALSSVVAACVCSGFAGVYLEKMFKGNTKKGLAIRNIQLATYGISAGLIGVYLKDGSGVTEHGFFFGYDSIVWASVLIQSLGGLLIAATMQYADNILKGFATSIAIVLTFLLSITFFHYSTGLLAFVGAVLVVCATAMYAYFSNQPTIVANAGYTSRKQSGGGSRSDKGFEPLLPFKSTSSNENLKITVK